MIVTLSPAKTLDFEGKCLTSNHSSPEFISESKSLINRLKKISLDDLGSLMSISEKLAKLNYDRYRSWTLPFDANNSRQALLAFKGDVYTGFNLEDWRAGDFNYAQKRLRILSGLYGILKPLDLIQAYRLEMGTALQNMRGKDLYEFWGERLTNSINQCIQDTRSKTLVNLASNEYANAIDLKSINVEVVTPTFKDFKNGKYKFISFYAKKARGMMADFIIRNKIKAPSKLLSFDCGGYYYCPESSSPNLPVFLRD